jgi:hypothetical protein
MIGGKELLGGDEGQGAGHQPNLRWASRAGGVWSKKLALSSRIEM